MNLLADECVDRPIVERLRQDGHVVLYVAEMEPGIDDDVVLDQANRQNAILLTADKDFGELIFRLNRIYAGVVLLRLAGLSMEMKSDIASTALSSHATEIEGAFSVVSPGIVRVRRKQ